MWRSGSLSGSAESLPLMLRPERSGAPPERFLAAVAERRGWIQDRLREHGGLLFRGFLRGEPAELESFTEAAGLRRMAFLRGNTRRRRMGQRIYTSTEVPGSLPIPLHCEMSYTVRHPSQIAFLCVLPARRGGETPVADMGRVRAALPPATRRRFERAGVTYLQWVPGRRLLPWRSSWREMFDTGDRAEVERICRQQQVETRWLRGDTLLLRNTRPASRRDASSGERFWFNHAHIFHPSFAWELARLGRHARALGVAAVELLFGGPLRRFAYRHSVCFGDGEPIPAADIRAVRETLWREARAFSWQRGDLVLLDNLRIAHGRLPFAGPRQILTALIERAEAGGLEGPASEPNAQGRATSESAGAGDAVPD